jgi:hypothetical protein
LISIAYTYPQEFFVVALFLSLSAESWLHCSARRHLMSSNFSSWKAAFVEKVAHCRLRTHLRQLVNMNVSMGDRVRSIFESPGGYVHNQRLLHGSHLWEHHGSSKGVRVGGKYAKGCGTVARKIHCLVIVSRQSRAARHCPRPEPTL